MKAGGGEIRVTEENKTEYLEFVCNWRMSGGIEEQIKSFLEGFIGMATIFRRKRIGVNFKKNSRN